jgi:hypothetical protein
MIGLLCFALAVLASLFNSKLRLEAENAVVPVGNQIRAYWWCNPPRIGTDRIRPTVSMGRVTGESLFKERCVRV